MGPLRASGIQTNLKPNQSTEVHNEKTWNSFTAVDVIFSGARIGLLENFPEGGASSPTATDGKANEPAKAQKIKVSILNGLWDMPAGVDPNKNKWTDVISKAFPELEINWVLAPAMRRNSSKRSSC
ncbi:hypothetical protein N6H14_04765 [Paenibacillus sp. CC-CFT747]|nr:hypothetical protein N6H14_04765 [Paenibacillus sp. CC-CFT747]